MTNHEICKTCQNFNSRSDTCFTCIGQNYVLKAMTNSARIRSMSDSELADFLCSLAYGGETPWSVLFNRQFCDNCPTEEFTVIETGQKMSLHECDFTDGVCPHGGSIEWWLKQPAETATDTNVGSKLQSN